tara:strand:+ start:584 stop:1003 length:420 start_codon:yes stop_codon:yes gene_type:complete
MWTRVTAMYSLPKDGGVYVMYNRANELIYVGQSNNLNNRLRQHPKRSELSYLKYKVIESADDRIRLESMLIEKLRPNLNKLHKLKEHEKGLVSIRASLPEKFVKALDIRQKVEAVSRTECLMRLLKEPLAKELSYLKDI